MTPWMLSLRHHSPRDGEDVECASASSLDAGPSSTIDTWGICCLNDMCFESGRTADKILSWLQSSRYIKAEVEINRSCRGKATETIVASYTKWKTFVRFGCSVAGVSPNPSTDGTSSRSLCCFWTDSGQKHSFQWYFLRFGCSEKQPAGTDRNFYSMSSNLRTVGRSLGVFAYRVSSDQETWPSQFLYPHWCNRGFLNRS